MLNHNAHFKKRHKVGVYNNESDFAYCKAAKNSLCVCFFANIFRLFVYIFTDVIYLSIGLKSDVHAYVFLVEMFNVWDLPYIWSQIRNKYQSASFTILMLRTCLSWFSVLLKLKKQCLCTCCKSYICSDGRKNTQFRELLKKVLLASPKISQTVFSIKASIVELSLMWCFFLL